MKGDGPGRRWPRGDGGTATAAATALSLLFLLFMLDATALGMHVVQLSLSCAGKDVSLSFLRLAYDGEELIRFEYSSNTFVAANPLAEPYVEGLNDDKRTVQNVARYIRRVPLISQIIEDSIRAETAKPAVTITARHPNGHEGPLVLTCRVDGFYPRDINTTWLRNGKDIDQEVLRSNILPNSDGTFQIRLQLSLDPSGGDTYSCQITHRSVPDNLTAVWVPKIQKVPVYGFVVGIMAGLVGILIAVSGGVMRWKGLHVMHQFCGCSQRGQRTVVTWVDSFDGETILYYQLDNKSFVATQPHAQSLVDDRNANLKFVESVPQLVSSLCDRIKRLVLLTNVTQERRAPSNTRAYTQRKLGQDYLVCWARGFFPRDVNVSWVRNGEVVEMGQETVDVVPESDGTYQVRSVRPLNEDGGKYVCQVEHEAVNGKLFIPLERKREVLNEGLIIIGAVLAILGICSAIVTTVVYYWLLHGGKKSGIHPTVNFNKKTGLCRTNPCGGSVHSKTSNSSNSSVNSADGLTKSSA